MDNFSLLFSGLRVIFDNDQSVDVVVPDIFKNDVFGLCGNFDGIEDNDFVVEGKVSFHLLSDKQ